MVHRDYADDITSCVGRSQLHLSKYADKDSDYNSGVASLQPNGLQCGDGTQSGMGTQCCCSSGSADCYPTTTTTLGTTTAAPAVGSNTMSGGIIIGIVIGSLVASIILCMGTLHCYKTKCSGTDKVGSV